MNPRYTLIGRDGNPVTEAGTHVAVLDTQTGLMWSAHPLHVSTSEDDDGESTGEVSHSDAEEMVSECDLAGFTDWRLPTVDELFALADRTRCNPAIDTDAFPDTPSDWFWTSTPWAGNPSSYAWFVGFGDGFANGGHRDGSAFVRAVRSPGQ